jgi:hydroxymethylpyrimidine pyrophosphatase-like HAD family hydrolase
VIRTTSPLDGASRWIEIFPLSVSKARGAEWVVRRHGIRDQDVLAVGNDYNDLDLLDWAAASYLVKNAPQPLHDLFPTVPSNDASGFSEAVSRWQRDLPLNEAFG